MSGKNVVWVLGAGFSRSLGGPLLPQLLSLGSRQALLARAESNKGAYWPDGADRVYQLYHYGIRYREGRVALGDLLPTAPGIDAWAHAEEFLEYLDRATVSDAARRRVHMAWEDICRHGAQTAEPLDLDVLVHTARRLVAAECMLFLDEVDTRTERWHPYRRWAQMLGGDDTVVTFNYDRVLESLADLAEARYFGARGWVVGSDFDSTFVRLAQLSLVLKLHGSVDWRRVRDDRGVRFERAPADFALGCPAGEIAIATPGLTKQSTTAELAPVWRRAESALEAADAVVFIGYRFPPSDAESRERLLAALASSKQPHVELHVVLGPTRDGDLARMEGLLSATARASGRNHLGATERHHGTRRDPSYGLTLHPLWAEDFLALWNREQLFAPDPFSPV